mgnify:CR=1 FL=1
MLGSDIARFTLKVASEIDNAIALPFGFRDGCHKGIRRARC